MSARRDQRLVSEWGCSSAPASVISLLVAHGPVVFPQARLVAAGRAAKLAHLPDHATADLDHLPVVPADRLAVLGVDDRELDELDTTAALRERQDLAPRIVIVAPQDRNEGNDLLGAAVTNEVL